MGIVTEVFSLYSWEILVNASLARVLEREISLWLVICCLKSPCSSTYCSHWEEKIFLLFFCPFTRSVYFIFELSYSYWRVEKNKSLFLKIWYFQSFFKFWHVFRSALNKVGNSSGVWVSRMQQSMPAWKETCWRLQDFRNEMENSGECGEWLTLCETDEHIFVVGSAPIFAYFV